MENKIIDLIENNKEFVESKFYDKQRKKLKSKQDPSCIVICCSDSRVPPEIVFQQFDLGELFVIRTAGHVLDEASLESIAYALSNFKELECIIILGHQNCGAIGAVYDELKANVKTSMFPKLHKVLKPSIVPNMIKLKRGNIINSSVKLHCKNTCKFLIENFNLNPLFIHTCYYTLHNGKVNCLCIH